MQLWELKQKIIEGNVPNLLIFIGEERSLSKMYLEQIERALNRKSLVIPSAVDAYNESLTQSLISTDEKLLVVKDDNVFKTEDAVNMWPRIKTITATLILMYTGTLDKRSKFYKEFEPYIVVFDKLKPAMILEALQAQVNVKADYLKWLIEICDSDFSRCLNEIDKIKLFADENVDLNELFKQFVKDGAFHADIPDCVFDFTSAMLKRNAKDAMEILSDLRRRGDSAIQILSLLYSNYRNLLSVQLCDVPTPDVTGLEEKQINAIKWNKGKYTNSELVDAVQLISELDRQIKIGVIDENIALEYFVARVL